LNGLAAFKAYRSTVSRHDPASRVIGDVAQQQHMGMLSIVDISFTTLTQFAAAFESADIRQYNRVATA
jgi:hypothetical protein